MIVNKSIQMLETVAAALKHLIEEVIFVGGAIGIMYVEKSFAEVLRPT
jgi:hypothetical protein